MNPYQLIKKQYQKILEARRRAQACTSVPVSSELSFLSGAGKPLRFGVIGAGHVFDRWMHDIRMLPPDAEIDVRAVCSRDPDRIRDRAAALGIYTVYGSYEALLADPEIDAVYVATPNHLHAAHAVQALRAGKHVLCEKPVCVTSGELEDILSAAREEGLLFMEGMWMRTLPMIRRLQDAVSSGAIGQLRLIQTRCCNSNDPDAFPALYSPAQAGGAMMDVGCYALHFAQLFLPLPEARATFAAELAPSGVDRSSTVILSAGGILSMHCQSIGAAGGAHATLHGTEGSIEVPLFLFPEEFTLISKGGQRIRYHYALDRDRRPIGYAYEILHFADLIRSGSATPELIPHGDTRAVLQIMEQFRRSCGLLPAANARGVSDEQ